MGNVVKGSDSGINPSRIVRIYHQNFTYEWKSARKFLAYSLVK